MPPQLNEQDSTPSDEEPPERIERKETKTYTNLEIMGIMATVKDGVTDKDVTEYSASLGGKVKQLFEDLRPEQKINVITFSRLDEELIKFLESNTFCIPGVHNGNTPLLIGTCRKCEEYRRNNGNINNTRKRINDLKIVAHL